MSVEQSLTLEASEVAIEGAAVRNGTKLSTNVIRFKKSVNLREDQQDFQFRYCDPRKLKLKSSICSEY
jgi:hypothetical protein